MHNHTWRKSSASTSEQGCIEIKITDDRFLARDSKDRNGGILIFPRDGWLRFHIYIVQKCHDL